MRRPILRWAALALPLWILSCGPKTGGPAPWAQAEPGYALMLQAAACWYGGVWQDIENQPEAVRKQAAEQRCRDVVRQVMGRDDQTFYEQLRSTTRDAVTVVRDKVAALAQNPHEERHRGDLAKLVEALGAAQHDNMWARRGADRLQLDIDQERPPEKISKDEAEAARAVGETRALADLLRLSAGDLTPDAHALGLLCAMDRMELSRGLANQRKLRAVAGALELVFGVKDPGVDGLQPLAPGQWLAYLVDAANAAGHPVPQSATTPRERDALAWGGVLAGFGDKIDEDRQHLSPSAVPGLSEPLRIVARRMHNEYQILQREAATEPPRPR